MTPDFSPLDLWLTEMTAGAQSGAFSWNPGFEAGRQIVVSKLGPYQKIFQQPAIYKPRSFHKAYALPIDEWRINGQIKLNGEFCTIDALVTIRFQATLKYAQANLSSLPEINQHVKSSCQSLIKDVIDQELRKLTSGAWVDEGLAPVERQIENQVNETLTLQNIQCRTLCEILTSFAEFGEAATVNPNFSSDDLYLKVMQKNFEVKERQNQERLRQELTLDQQRLERQKRLIDQYNHEQELLRIEQEQAAHNRKQQLEEQEKQLAEQFNIEHRMHKEQVFHEHNLKRMEQEALAETQRLAQQQQQETEERLLRERLEHQHKLKAIQLAAEIEDFEKNQVAWNLTHERLKIEKIEQEKRLKQLENEAQLALQDVQQNEEHKLQERLARERLMHEARMKDMELEIQIREHEKRYAATQQLDDYIRRDIELLILEKHRGELVQEVKKSRQDEIPSLPLQLHLEEETGSSIVDQSLQSR